MFRDTRRKRLRNKVIFAVLGICILVFGLWLNYKTVVDEDGSQEAVNKIKTEETEDKDRGEKNSGEFSDEEERANDSENDNDRADMQKRPDSYLVKEVDGVVKVYECTDDKKDLYLITSIPFDLLSENDQQMFIDGVEMSTEDELGEFLENFDS